MALTTQVMEEFELLNEYTRESIRSLLSTQNGYQVTGNPLIDGSIQVEKSGERFWVMMIGIIHKGIIQTYDQRGNFFWYVPRFSTEKWQDKLMSECNNHVNNSPNLPKPPVYLFLKNDKSKSYYYLGEAEPVASTSDDNNAYFYSRLLEFRRNKENFLRLKELVAPEPHDRIEQSLLRSRTESC